MYIADVNYIEGDGLSSLSAQTDDAYLWHRRLGSYARKSKDLG